jgi:hypothetical protein
MSLHDRKPIVQHLEPGNGQGYLPKHHNLNGNRPSSQNPQKTLPQKTQIRHNPNPNKKKHQCEAEGQAHTKKTNAMAEGRA